MDRKYLIPIKKLVVDIRKGALLRTYYVRPEYLEQKRKEFFGKIGKPLINISSVGNIGKILESVKSFNESFGLESVKENFKNYIILIGQTILNKINKLNQDNQNYNFGKTDIKEKLEEEIGKLIKQLEKEYNDVLNLISQKSLIKDIILNPKVSENENLTITKYSNHILSQLLNLQKINFVLTLDKEFLTKFTTLYKRLIKLDYFFNIDVYIKPEYEKKEYVKYYLDTKKKDNIANFLLGFFFPERYKIAIGKENKSGIYLVLDKNKVENITLNEVDLNLKHKQNQYKNKKINETKTKEIKGKRIVPEIKELIEIIDLQQQSQYQSQNNIKRIRKKKDVLEIYIKKKVEKVKEICCYDTTYKIEKVYGYKNGSYYGNLLSRWANIYLPHFTKLEYLLQKILGSNFEDNERVVINYLYNPILFFNSDTDIPTIAISQSVYGYIKDKINLQLNLDFELLDFIPKTLVKKYQLKKPYIFLKIFNKIYNPEIIVFNLLLLRQKDYKTYNQIKLKLSYVAPKIYEYLNNIENLINFINKLDIKLKELSQNQNINETKTYFEKLANIIKNLFLGQKIENEFYITDLLKIGILISIDKNVIEKFVKYTYGILRELEKNNINEIKNNAEWFYLGLNLYKKTTQDIIIEVEKGYNKVNINQFALEQYFRYYLYPYIVDYKKFRTLIFYSQYGVELLNNILRNKYKNFFKFLEKNDFDVSKLILDELFGKIYKNKEELENDLNIDFATLKELIENQLNNFLKNVYPLLELGEYLIYIDKNVEQISKIKNISFAPINFLNFINTVFVSYDQSLAKTPYNFMGDSEILETIKSILSQISQSQNPLKTFKQLYKLYEGNNKKFGIHKLTITEILENIFSLLDISENLTYEIIFKNYTKGNGDINIFYIPIEYVILQTILGQYANGILNVVDNPTKNYMWKYIPINIISHIDNPFLGLSGIFVNKIFAKSIIESLYPLFKETLIKNIENDFYQNILYPKINGNNRFIIKPIDQTLINMAYKFNFPLTFKLPPIQFTFSQKFIDEKYPLLRQYYKTYNINLYSFPIGDIYNKFINTFINFINETKLLDISNTNKQTDKRKEILINLLKAKLPFKFSILFQSILI